MTYISCSYSLSLYFSYILLYWFIYFLSCVLCLLVFSYIIAPNRTGLFNLQNVRFFSFFRLSLIVCFVSLAGLPPFSGFWLKLAISMLIAGTASLFFLIIFWCLLLLSLFFYLRILRYFYAWSTVNETGIATVSERHIVILVWLFLLICFGGLLFNDFLLLANSFFL